VASFQASIVEVVSTLPEKILYKFSICILYTNLEKYYIRRPKTIVVSSRNIAQNQAIWKTNYSQLLQHDLEKR
jgi:hypothetical protein